MDKNEAFQRARDLENEYRAVVYLREMLEAAVTAEQDASRAKDSVKELAKGIEDGKAELVSLRSEKDGLQKLVDDARAKANASMQDLSNALAEAQTSAKATMDQLQSDIDAAKRAAKQWMEKAQQDAAEKSALLEGEYRKLIEKLSNERSEEEQKLNEAKKSYADFMRSLQR